MEYEGLIVETRDHVATITLNRPERYNAIDLQLAQELTEAVLTCSEDPGVRALVITGAGSVFSGGGNVKEFGKRLGTISRYLKELTTVLHIAISRICRMPKPVVAAVNGVAAGGGMSLVLACDLVVAAESARFTMAYAGIGATPDGSSSYFLPRLIGVKRAFDLFYTNRTLTAKEAEAWGLVNKVIPDADFNAAVHELATQLAKGPTLAYGRAKRLLHVGSQESLETQMEHESELIALNAMTADFQEGVKAFVEKRRPSFGGK
jgi:2-(1,2-epoxy-1,2-dihydrophenyl)acetyl-CoA isomerase